MRHVTLREAVVEDAPFLVDLWTGSIRRADRQEQIADLESVVKAAAESPERRVVVAEYDGVPAGAVMLRLTTVSPVNLEPAVATHVPHVLPAYRRKGIGRALMEAAVSFAEELGVGHMAAAAASGSRDGNRFLARLGFGPQAVYRVATTPMVRARLAAQRGGQRATAGRPALGQVLAARRSQRRAQA